MWHNFRVGTLAAAITLGAIPVSASPIEAFKIGGFGLDMDARVIERAAIGDRGSIAQLSEILRAEGALSGGFDVPTHPNYGFNQIQDRFEAFAPSPTGGIQMIFTCRTLGTRAVQITQKRHLPHVTYDDVYRAVVQRYGAPQKTVQSSSGGYRIWLWSDQPISYMRDDLSGEYSYPPIFDRTSFRGLRIMATNSGSVLGMEVDLKLTSGTYDRDMAACAADRVAKEHSNATRHLAF